MWHEKPENSVVPGRTTSPNGSSKKRKERVFDIPGTGSECYVLWESDRQEFSSLNEQQGSEEDARLNLKRSAEQITFHGHHDLQYQNYFSQVWLTSTVTSHGSGVDSVGDGYSNVQVQDLRHMGPSSIMMTVAESTMAPNQQPGTCYLSTQYEKNSDAAQCGFNFQSFQRPGNQNCTAPDIIVQQATLHQVSDHADMYSEGLNGRLTDLSSTETLAFLGASLANKSDKCETLQTVLQFHRSHVGSLLRNTCESKEQILTDHIEMKQKPEMSEMEKSKNSLMVSLPSKNGCSPDKIVENDQKNEKTCVSLKVDETSKLSSGKPSSAVAEKLWDGRVQLNSSVTMSAVAFFKSGEKLPDISWSDFVEVKGKVRLEAFEKYIQDLPRSRSRRLMVISLCVKEGSSRTELTGMTEVSQGYKKGGRVGFAQLSAGIDLYICPHTDTIITILAKYGFFKGMAAIEDNRDSLIGCVVWRKNQFSSNFTAKNLECNNNSLSEQPPLDHLSGSSTHQVAEKKLAPIQTTHHINQSAPLVTMLSSPSLESAAENGRASKKINSSDIQLEVTKPSSAATAALAPVVPSNSSIIQIGQQMSAPFYEVCQGSNTQLRELEVSWPAVTGEKFEMISDRKKDTTAVQSNGPRSIKPIFDEDDLPEYDFGTANRSNYIDVSLLARKLHAEGNWMLEGLVSTNASVMQARSTSNNGSDNVDICRNISAPNPGIPPPKTVGERPLCHNSEEKSNFERIATPTLPVVSAFASTSVSFTRLPNKNQLFDDDDDMPEWCPPEPYNRSHGKASKPLTTLSTELPNSSSGNIPHVGPLPVILPPPPARFHSHFSYQPFGPALQVTGTISVNAPQIMPQCSPNFSTSFRPSPSWGPQSDQPTSMAIQNGPGFSTGSNPSLALRLQSGQLNSMPIQNGSGFSTGFNPSK